MSFFSWLRKRTSNRCRNWDGLQIRHTAPRFRPHLEALEQRYVPSTMKHHSPPPPPPPPPAPPGLVTNLGDSGPGSLRYEIAAANPGNTINFAPSLDGHTITLTSGELDINKNLTIQGPGAGLLTITSPGMNTSTLYNYGSSRIFEVESFVTNATLSGMTISNGVGLNSSYNPYAPYGSSGDYYDGTGGGVLNLGTLTLSGCTLSNNFAAVYVLFGAGGGGVANFGTLKVSDCTLSNNSTRGNGGGIFNAAYCTLTVSGGALSGNSGDSGGGIYNSGNMTVSGCTLSGNAAWGNGSGANDGQAIEYGYGGGICNFGGTATVSSCTLSGNSAYSGGGIYNAWTTLTVSNTTFTSNTPDNIFGAYTDGGGNTFN
jgi:hypothetical protein